MFVDYKPADGDAQRWEFHAGEVLAGDAETVERAFADTWDNFLVSVLKGGMRARRVLLWHLIRIEHPSLTYQDTPNFRVDELKIEYDQDELRQMRDGFAAENKIDDATRDAVLDYLDREIAKAPESGSPGKARSKPSA